MNWGQPQALWMLLLFVPILTVFLWWGFRRRQVLMKQFVSSRLLGQLTVGVSTTRQKIRALLVLVAVTFLILSLARPEWGFTWEEATQRGRDIVVAIDTSRSMLANDVQPDRLTRAKLAALDLLKLAKRDRLSLVAFAGSAFLQCPLTLDDEAFRQSVTILEPGIIPQGGTALREAIETALTAFKKEEGENHRVLIIFTDGEDHESGIEEALKKAREEGLRIFTVGVGTPGGELLRLRDASGAVNYVKDEQGNVVKSKLNEQLLKQIASGANGTYFHLEGAHTIETLYQNWLAPLPTSEFSAKLVKHFKEQYYWPLAIAMLLLVIEIFLPDQRRTKRAQLEKESLASPLKAAALLALTVLSLNASPAKARSKYSAGDYKDALNEYERLLEKKPDDPRLHYNAGAAAYQARKYDTALKQFSEAVTSPSLDLQQMAYYNMGNAEYRLGESQNEPQQKMGNWQDAVKNYESALKLNPNDADAKFNRDLVQKKLEELQKQQQQKDKNKKDQNKDNKDEKDKDKNEQKDNKSDEKKKEDQQKQDQQKENKDQKQDQEKKDQEKQDQQKQQQQEQQKEDQAASDQKKLGEEKQAQQNQGKPGEDKDQQQAMAQPGKAVQMTPQQAQQLLEAQKGEERALIFLPQNQKRSAQNRGFKDW
jgi:Ca-activated chloride channel family protein